MSRTTWLTRGIVRGQPWAAQFRLPIGIASGHLYLARPVGAGVVQLADIPGVVSGAAGRVITFRLTGAQTTALPACQALADVWICPATGSRFELFRPSPITIADPVAPPPGGPGSGPGSSGALYPATILFPAATRYPDAP